MNGTRAYRPCVGAMVFNPQGRVFVGKRIDNPSGDWWQMPQGGVNPGEDRERAVLRELAEESGIGPELVKIIASLPQPLRYDLPAQLQGKLWGGQYCGQEQYWYLLRFCGSDDQIDLAAHHPPEFSDWKWVEPEALVEAIVPFKRDVYRKLVEHFAPLIRQHAGPL